MAERAAEALREDRVERLLAGVAEGRVAEVVAKRDRLGQVLVQPQRAGHDPGDTGRLERVRQARAEVIASGCHEDLRLVLQTPERLRVHDAVAIALEGRSQPAFFLGAARPRVSYERTANGESDSSSSARICAENPSATRPASSGAIPVSVAAAALGLGPSAVREGTAHRDRASPKRRRRSDDDRHGAAVGAPSGPRHIARTVGAEEGDHSADLVGLRHPADRPPLADILEHLFARLPGPGEPDPPGLPPRATPATGSAPGTRRCTGCRPWRRDLR